MTPALSLVTQDSSHNYHQESLIELFDSWLQKYSSVKTRKDYEKDVKDFFTHVYKKEINNVLQTNVQFVQPNVLLKQRHIIEYRNNLQKKYANASVNRKIASVSSFFKFLKGHDCSISPEIFSIGPLPLHTKTYDVLDVEQIEQIAEKAINCLYGNELFAFMYFSPMTCIRVSAVLALTWDQITYDKKHDYYKVVAIDKGGEQVYGAVTHQVYKYLVNCKSDESNLLFPNLKADYINDTIKRLAKELDIPGRIVTHSLRKSAPTYEMDTTGNLKKGMQITGHKSEKVFTSTYMNLNTVDYNPLAGIRMFTPIQEDVSNDFSKEEILQTLKKINHTAYHQLMVYLAKIKGE